MHATAVLTASVFSKLKNVSCEYYHVNGWNSTLQNVDLKNKRDRPANPPTDGSRKLQAQVHLVFTFYVRRTDDLYDLCDLFQLQFMI